MNDQILSFLQEALRIKQMIRSGWIYSGVPKSEVESVADHSYMVTLLALIIALEEQRKGNEINLEKTIIMALLHDLSESISQDIDRRIRKFSPKEYDNFKNELDTNATKFLFSKLPQEVSTKLLDYLSEFRKAETKEARIVVEADRLETILQLNEYQKLGISKNKFQEFYTNMSNEIQSYQFELVKYCASKLLKE
ncbi:MAG: HD family hydrolase [Candidatus Heimdallarchaeota archaeon]|nr:HD family hydrolase [Candidatus Heimdallarchaeota archaeon]